MRLILTGMCICQFKQLWNVSWRAKIDANNQRGVGSSSTSLQPSHACDEPVRIKH